MSELFWPLPTKLIDQIYFVQIMKAWHIWPEIIYTASLTKKHMAKEKHLKKMFSTLVQPLR
jgi:hypothetical protein